MFCLTQKPFDVFQTNKKRVRDFWQLHAHNLICRRKTSKGSKVTITESSGGSSIYLESKKTPSSPPYGSGSKRKKLPEDAQDD